MALRLHIDVIHTKYAVGGRNSFQIVIPDSESITFLFSFHFDFLLFFGRSQAHHIVCVSHASFIIIIGCIIEHAEFHSPDDDDLFIFFSFILHVLVRGFLLIQIL